MADEAQVPETQVADPTMQMTLDQKIQPKEPVELDKIDINKAVTPGHDMVVNHVDGSQELAEGNVAAAIHAAEAADPTKTVSPADVTATVQENPRTPDPEVNGPDQQVPGETADQVVAASQPEALEAPATPEETPEEETPEEATDAAGKAPATEAEPTAADVEGV